MGEENEKIKEAKILVRNSEEITGAHKDSLMDVLIAVGRAANGSQDKVADTASAIESMGIYMARDADHRPGDFRRIMREVLPPLLEDAFRKHKQDCPLVKDWNGVDRRGSSRERGSEPEPTMTAKSKWFDFRATGKMGMEPMIRLAKVIMYSAVCIALVYKAGEILEALRVNNALLEKLHP